MSILIKGMDMRKDGTYTSNIHVKDGKAVLDNPIGVGYFELVEVVRCKYCKRRDICRSTKIWASPPADDWFCADGERREDEQIH